jgi:hypothetical protein
MARKKEEWISANEAAEILTANTDHTVSSDYVRMLAKAHKITFRAKNDRENEYLKSDIEAYHVRPKHTPRVRPRPSTRKQEAA